MNIFFAFPFHHMYTLVSTRMYTKIVITKPRPKTRVHKKKKKKVYREIELPKAGGLDSTQKTEHIVTATYTNTIRCPPPPPGLPPPLSPLPEGLHYPPKIYIYIYVYTRSSYLGASPRAEPLLPRKRHLVIGGARGGRVYPRHNARAIALLIL